VKVRVRLDVDVEAGEGICGKPLALACRQIGGTAGLGVGHRGISHGGLLRLCEIMPCR
jgi:hypothetical protein